MKKLYVGKTLDGRYVTTPNVRGGLIGPYSTTYETLAMFLEAVRVESKRRLRIEVFGSYIREDIEEIVKGIKSSRIRVEDITYRGGSLTKRRRVA